MPVTNLMKGFDYDLIPVMLSVECKQYLRKDIL